MGEGNGNEGLTEGLLEGTPERGPGAKGQRLQVAAQ